jgi:hypothetical protein
MKEHAMIEQKKKVRRKNKLVDIEALQKRFPELDVLSEMESAQNYLESRGKRMKSFNAFFINWLKRAPDFKPKKFVSSFQNIKDKKSANITYLIDFKDGKNYKELTYGERFAGDPELKMKVSLEEDCEIFKQELSRMFKSRLEFNEKDL